jgi:hypothetical protein
MAQVQISAKRIGLMFLLLAGTLFGLFLYALPSRKPPREKELIENFYTHRPAYERLRDMLMSDEQLLRVASWGVETTKSGPHRIQEGADIPLNRYNEYLALLNQAGGKGAFRKRGENPDLIGIDMWASGFGGDTRHVDICWMNYQPANQVTSLDAYYRTPKPRNPVFRHIEGNWYLFADW